MTTRTDFEAMGIMAKQDQDIALLATFVEANKNKKGCTITMGCPDPLATQFLLNPDKYLVAMYLIDKDQFNEAKHQE